MKKVKNIATTFIYYLCLPFAGIIYVIVDTYRSFKVKTDLPESDIEIGNIKTTYPEGWTSKPSTEDFNNFFSDIHKKLN